jgi:hypothetical protein
MGLRREDRMRIQLKQHVLVAVALLAVATAGVEPSQQAGRTLPSRLDAYLTQVVKLTPRERETLLQGGAVTKLLDADPSKEVAVFAATWIDAPPRRYVDAVQDIERFERGRGFNITRRISNPPRLEDFAEMRLPDEDVRALRSCRVGDCDVKVSEKGLQRFHREVDWNAPDAADKVNAIFRELGYEYVKGYLEGGNDRLAVYRDDQRPRFVADEFRLMVNSMPELTDFMPNVRRYLLEFPRVNMSDTISFLYWQETEFGLKPTIRISHLSIRESPTETVVASKMLYASHYFWTGLELRTLLPDPSRGQGFWFVTVSRSRSDGLSGFRGMFVRGRVQNAVRNGALSAVQATKRRLEQGAAR